MNSPIISLIKRGNSQLAFSRYEKRCENFLHLDTPSLLGLLRACAECKDIEKGNRIHAHVSENTLLSGNHLIANALINFYSRCGLLDKAKKVFDDLPFRDVVSWNTLLAGYVKHAHCARAIKCLEHMQLEGITPDAVTFVCCLKACGSIEDAGTGRRLHGELATTGLLKTNLIVGNALMDMYGKCGLPAKAQEVFDNLVTRDVISWNILMTGYLKAEQGEKALYCYKNMQRDGILSNVVTFVCGLKACGLAEATQKGQEVHQEISRIGLLEKNPVLGGALVDMYARWGWLAKAEEVFRNLMPHDVNACNALISGYVRLEFFEEAMKFSEEMKDHGVTLDAITLVCILKACGRLRNVLKGREIHSEIERKGLSDRNLIVATALVDMYAKCGRLTIAQELFDGLWSKDLVSWNSLIAGYVDHECAEEALVAFDRMKASMVSPNAVTFACTLKACGILQLAELGSELHGEIARKGVSNSDLLVGNALLDMYAKCGFMVLARGVFDSLLLVRDEISWTNLISGYIDAESCEESLRCFEQMQVEGFVLDGIALVCGLKSCGSLRMIHEGKLLHAKIAETVLLERDIVVGTALVDMYVKCGLLGEAQKVLCGLPARDTVSWNALIAGYAESGLSTEAFRCIQTMGGEGVSPDLITLTCNLRACSDSEALNRARELLGAHASLSLEGNPFVGNALVNTLAKSGFLPRAHDVFDKLPVRDLVSWNALISGNMKHENSEEALVCLEQMKAEGVLPDHITFVCSLKAYGSTGAVEKGREIHAEIARRRVLETDTVVGNAVVDMYAKCCRLAKAEEVFDELTFHDLITYNVLISGYAQLGDSGRVFDMLNRMRNEGYEPDSITFISVLYACSQAVLVERGQACFNMMSQGYGINPSIEHHTCMIDLYARAGVLHQAASRIGDLPVAPDAAVWLTVLEACRKWGNTELGKKAHRCAMDVNNTGSLNIHYGVAL